MICSGIGPRPVSFRYLHEFTGQGPVLLRSAEVLRDLKSRPIPVSPT